MWRFVYFVLVLCAVALSTGNVEGDAGDSAVPVAMKKYTVDLDQPPEKRWLSILPDYKNSVPLILSYFNQSKVKIALPVLDEMLSNIEAYFGEYGLEMKAIAEYFGIDLGIVVTLNLSYELRRLGGGRPNTTGNSSDFSPRYNGGMGCTSIVARNKSGNVFQGRNLDWDAPNDLRNLSVLADFVKNGKVVFTGVVAVGMVGIFTGISNQGGFSLSINERDLGGGPIEDGITGLLKKSLCPSHLARMILTSSSSFINALEMLRTKSLVAPVYFITAGSGINEGAVVTRERDSCYNLWMLDDSENQTLNWYLLETNYDQWKEPKPYDNRREYGNHYMQELGQESAATVDGLFSILSRWPIKNNLTTYTTVMVPGEFFIRSFDLIADYN